MDTVVGIGKGLGSTEGARPCMVGIHRMWVGRRSLAAVGVHRIWVAPRELVHGRCTRIWVG